jgi:putative transposase
VTRPLRIEYAGAVYHITSRGNDKKAVFKDDLDRINFLNTLQHVNKETYRVRSFDLTFSLLFAKFLL